MLRRGKHPSKRSRGEPWLGRGELSPYLLSLLPGWAHSSQIAAASWQISTCSKSVTAHLSPCLNQKKADGGKGRRKVGGGKAGCRGKGSRSSRTEVDMPGMGFLLHIFLGKEHFLWQQQLQQHPNCTFEWYCQVAQGCAGFMEVKHNILTFSEASGLAKYNINLRVRKKKKKRGNNSNYESGKSQQISPEILIAFHFQSSINIAKTAISNSSVITAILCPSAETVQHKL